MNPYAPPFQPSYAYDVSSEQDFQQRMMQQQRMHSQKLNFQQQQQPPPSQQQQQAQHQQQQQQQQNMLSDHLLVKMYSHPNATALFEVQIGLEQMVYESCEYDTWANAIRDRLTCSDIRSEELHIAVDIIIEMAVAVDNCQYNFARLCHLLNGHIRLFASNCLVPKLTEFVFQHNEYLMDQELQHLLLFLAELYVKIEVNGMRLTQIAALIYDELDFLLKLESIHDGIMKTVIQVLKLVGRYLEADQDKSLIDSIFSRISDLCFNSNNLSESIKGQILALNQLKQNNWGVNDQASSSNGAVRSNGAAKSTKPSSMVIMGPDGKPLTDEECAFLEAHGALCGDAISPTGSWNEALEEDEVLEDYEKFLQATAIAAAEKALEKMSFEDDEVESIASGSVSGAHSFATSSPKKCTTSSGQDNYKTKTENNLTIVKKEKRNDDSATFTNTPSATVEQKPNNQ